MNSFFFIPGNKIEFLKKADRLNATYIVIDLEDALYNSDVEVAINNIIDLKIPKDYYIRIAFSNYLPVDHLSYIKRLLDNGFHRFMIPKVKSGDDLAQILDYFKINSTIQNAYEFIVLVENSKAIFNLNNIINRDEVVGVGLGSHDYCDDLGMKHTYENLYWARMSILNSSKAFGKEVIDIASMNINNESEFSKECIDSFEKGFDAKFIIHPWQLEIYNRLSYYSNEEIEQAIAVRNYILNIGGESNFTIANIMGSVIERPHLKRIKHILKTTRNEGF